MTSFTNTTFVQIAAIIQRALEHVFREKNLGVCILEHVHFIEQIRYNQ